MNWGDIIKGTAEAACKGHDQVVKNQQQYSARARETCGYGISYEEGQRLWREHKQDGKAKSVLDSHWRFAPADQWNQFADGYDDCKNADGISGRGPRKQF